MAETVWRHPEP